MGLAIYLGFSDETTVLGPPQVHPRGGGAERDEARGYAHGCGGPGSQSPSKEASGEPMRAGWGRVGGGGVGEALATRRLDLVCEAVAADLAVEIESLGI